MVFVSVRKNTHTQMEAKSSSIKSQQPAVCVFGLTGSGKSAALNSLVEGEPFESSSSAKACTQYVSFQEHNWYDSKAKVNVCDTPGLSDTEDRDQDIVNSIRQVITNHGYPINAFLIVVNGQEPRLSNAFQDMFASIHEMFGNKFLPHVRFVFTKWGLDKSSVRKRKQKGESESKRKKEIQELLANSYFYQRPVPCFFLETLDFDDAEFCTDELREQRSNLKESCCSTQAYEVRDLKQIELLKSQQEKRQKLLDDLSEMFTINEGSLELSKEIASAQKDLIEDIQRYLKSDDNQNSLLSTIRSIMNEADSNYKDKIRPSLYNRLTDAGIIQTFYHHE